MKNDFLISIRFTIAITILFGVLYPLCVTGLSQLLFHDQANGELILRHGRVVGSKLIGQAFAGPSYFHSRPSAAGAGYDASASGGSNLAPTNKALLERVAAGVKSLQQENPGALVPVDLVTSSASGLDPDISPAAADFQIPRVARERGLTESQLRALVTKHTEPRQWGFLGEPRVNVLELNLDLDELAPAR